MTQAISVTIYMHSVYHQWHKYMSLGKYLRKCLMHMKPASIFLIFVSTDLGHTEPVAKHLIQNLVCKNMIRWNVGSLIHQTVLFVW